MLSLSLPSPTIRLLAFCPSRIRLVLHFFFVRHRHLSASNFDWHNSLRSKWINIACDWVTQSIRIRKKNNATILNVNVNADGCRKYSLFFYSTITLTAPAAVVTETIDKSKNWKTEREKKSCRKSNGTWRWLKRTNNDNDPINAFNWCHS